MNSLIKDLLYIQFKEMMEGKGFVVAERLPHDNVTVFGKSQPDLTFYKGNGEYMKGKGVSGAIICTEAWEITGAIICTEAWEITGATIELKKSEVHVKSRSTTFAQLCTNMIRVSGFLAEKALYKGCMLEKITILGLLVSHTSRFCVPLRYTHVNGETLILKGDEMLFNQAIAMIIAHI